MTRISRVNGIATRMNTTSDLENGLVIRRFEEATTIANPVRVIREIRGFCLDLFSHGERSRNEDKILESVSSSSPRDAGVGRGPRRGVDPLFGRILSPALPCNRRLEDAFSLSPREARAGRESERGASQKGIPPLPNPLLPPASGREGDETEEFCGFRLNLRSSVSICGCSPLR
jgi:hypothetical protein